MVRPPAAIMVNKGMAPLVSVSTGKNGWPPFTGWSRQWILIREVGCPLGIYSNSFPSLLYSHDTLYHPFDNMSTADSKRLENFRDSVEKKSISVYTMSGTSSSAGTRYTRPTFEGGKDCTSKTGKYHRELASDFYSRLKYSRNTPTALASSDEHHHFLRKEARKVERDMPWYKWPKSHLLVGPIRTNRSGTESDFKLRIGDEPTIPSILSRLPVEEILLATQKTQKKR